MNWVERRPGRFNIECIIQLYVRDILSPRGECDSRKFQPIEQVGFESFGVHPVHADSVGIAFPPVARHS